MNEDFKKIFKEVPEFLSILGFKKAYYDEDQDSWNVEFLPTKNLTHSDGTILQGGFVTGMMDASMAQFIMYQSKGKDLPLTLDIDVKFLKPCSPNIKVIASSTIVKKGKSIAFTRCELHQNDSLIAVSSATNKLINL